MENTFFFLRVDALESDFSAFNLITGVFKTAIRTDRRPKRASANDLLAIGGNTSRYVAQCWSATFETVAGFG